MSVLARVAWEALSGQVRGALASRVARRIALREAGVTAVAVAWDDECAGLCLAVHLRVATGFNAAKVAALVRQVISRRLPSSDVIVRATGP